MAYNIPELLSSRKVREALVLVSVVLLGVVSFGLGRLSAQEGGRVHVLVCDSGAGAVPLAGAQGQGAAVLTGTEDASKSPEDAGANAATQAQGTYVASKTGTVYHLPWCSGAKRIKEENKVWFASKEEAEAAGYRPAANCKGI